MVLLASWTLIESFIGHALWAVVIGCLGIYSAYIINNPEKKILLEMLSNPGKTYSRLQIGEISNISQERSIDVMITRLRQKIEINPKNPKYLQTIRGSGYVLWVE